MSFCSFSKEFTNNSYTLVDNQFITKYMPQSDGFTVKVFLYGLFLCQNSNADYTVKTIADFFSCDEEKIKEAFSFWEDYDLVRVISKEPFGVEYLPVSTALGRPKKVRYDKYGDFCKEMQNKMQKVGKFVSYSENIKYMNFLQENNIEQQAFLLIAQYCINKKGENVTQSYIVNKAKKFIASNLITYQQVENELSGYNIHESELLSIFTSLNTFKTPEEGDYTYFDKWTNKYGFSLNAIKCAAKTLKKGSMDVLDILLQQLYEADKITDNDVSAYLTERELLSSLTFKIARKLSVKINSPQTYIDEYVEKWYDKGYDEESLSAIAVYCVKMSKNSFIEMHSLIEELYRKSIITPDAVNAYISAKMSALNLLIKIKNLCGSVKISSSALSMIDVWHEWNFSDNMILEAAKKSTTTVSPIPYMNKILSDWKHQNIFTEKEIPQFSAPATAYTPAVNPTVKALDDKAERERYYDALRRKAQSLADKYIKKAETNPDYVKISSQLSYGNIELAKAKVFDKDRVEELKLKIDRLKKQQSDTLASMGLTENMLLPQYSCKQCSDTGFLPNGKACDCYKKKSS